ncbi:MAG: glycosyltransferase, partial [bacterium]
MVFVPHEMDRAMKVLVISHAYAAPINRQKVKALSRRPGLSMSLLLPRFWKEGERVYITEPGEEGFRIFTGNVLFPGRIGRHVYRNGLIRALRTVHPDVIHLEEEPWSLVAAQVMAASAFLKPRPKLVLFSFENLDLNLRRTYRVIERRLLARADVLLAGGQTVRDRLLRRGADPKRVVVLPQFGLDPDFFRLPGPGESPKTFTVGFIGRLVPEKGVDLLIRALSEIEGDWRALIVGDG